MNLNLNLFTNKKNKKIELYERYLLKISNASASLTTIHHYLHNPNLVCFSLLINNNLNLNEKNHNIKKDSRLKLIEDFNIESDVYVARVTANKIPPIKISAHLPHLVTKVRYLNTSSLYLITPFSYKIIIHNCYRYNRSYN